MTNLIRKTHSTEGISKDIDNSCGRKEAHHAFQPLNPGEEGQSLVPRMTFSLHLASNKPLATKTIPHTVYNFARSARARWCGVAHRASSTVFLFHLFTKNSGSAC
eukprot:scaffold6929_cov99-Cylindrotheca_fusiformis.AAC.2